MFSWRSSVIEYCWRFMSKFFAPGWMASSNVVRTQTTDVGFVAHLGGDGVGDGGLEAFAGLGGVVDDPRVEGGFAGGDREHAVFDRRRRSRPRRQPAVPSVLVGGIGAGRRIGVAGRVVVAAAGGEDEGADGNGRDDPAQGGGGSHDDLLQVVVHAGRETSGWHDRAARLVDAYVRCRGQTTVDRPGSNRSVRAGRGGLWSRRSGSSGTRSVRRSPRCARCRPQWSQR